MVMPTNTSTPSLLQWMVENANVDPVVV